ncbi:hypothetical protein NL676_005752 [Syzygium grande]|nr:hypothetical protein NL676_005752 [Syzygium grande]
MKSVEEAVSLAMVREEQLRIPLESATDTAPQPTRPSPPPTSSPNLTSTTSSTWIRSSPLRPLAGALRLQPPPTSFLPGASPFGSVATTTLHKLPRRPHLDPARPLLLDPSPDPLPPPRPVALKRPRARLGGASSGSRHSRAR